MTIRFKSAALALAVPGLLAGAAPALAAPAFDTSPAAHAAGVEQGWNKHRRHWQDDRSYRSYGGDRYYDSRYDNRAYNGRTWRGRDGRYYCRRDNGTTGTLIGGAVGGLMGHEIAGRGDRTVGTILGVAGGALLGRAIDRSGSRCR